MTTQTTPVGVGMIGCGTVGGGVAELLRDQGELYRQRTGRSIELRRVLVRDKAKAVASGLVTEAQVTDAPDDFFATEAMDVILEVAGGLDPIAGHVRRALGSGRHVVTANKALLAARGAELFALAREHDVSIAFEASCGGGIPCVTALQQGLMGNEIHTLVGILNGTCNFILSQMTRRGESYGDALEEAQRLGYAEADPTLDVSGRDAAQKLAILGSLAFGVNITGQRVPAVGVSALEVEDIGFAAEMGYDVKLLAIAQQPSVGGPVSVSVEPCFIAQGSILATVGGPFNALSVIGHAAGHTLYYGAGAGRLPTASAVVGDLLNVVSGGYPAAFANTRLTPDLHEDAALLDGDELVSRFFLRLHAIDRPGVIAQVTRILGDSNISLSAMLQHESESGRHVPVVITTHQAKRGDVRWAMDRIAALDPIAGEPVVIRILDMPE